MEVVLVRCSAGQKMHSLNCILCDLEYKYIVHRLRPDPKPDVCGRTHHAQAICITDTGGDSGGDGDG